MIQVIIDTYDVPASIELKGWATSRGSQVAFWKRVLHLQVQEVSTAHCSAATSARVFRSEGDIYRDGRKKWTFSTILKHHWSQDERSADLLSQTIP